MAKHKPVEEAQVRKFLPLVARHFSQQRAFSVYDFVVREWQDKILGECLQKAKRNLVVMVAPKYRILRHVSKHVMHPTHIPFETESKTANIIGPRDQWPSGRFLRDRHYVRKCCIDAFIEAPQEFNGLNVFFSAIAIRYPFALRSSIIEIQHGSDGINTEAVHMILVQPEQGITDQETPDFVSAVVENESVPVRMFSFSRIGVLVKVRPIEIAQTRLILRKMSRNPIQNHANFVLMKIVHEILEVVRGPKSACRGEVTRCLVSPGAIEGMFHYWK